MAIRYAKFLGIMVQIALPAASSSPDIASKGGMGEYNGDAGFQLNDGFEEVAYGYTFNNVTVEGVSDWNALLDLDLAPDLFMWWESMYS
jgi:hypothetical protein